LENGSEVFACSIDKTKAFDLCKFSVLFRKMIKNLSLIFLRLVIFMYVNQFCNVRWGTETSSGFTIKNGVGQGKILAGFAYCYYCFDLFVLLEKSNFGCKINGEFAGAFGFSDDDFFLAPSISSLQGMLKIAESYCNSHGLRFSTDPNPEKSKTKCIAWIKAPRALPKLQLCGDSLPWVNKVVHLGNTITNQSVALEADMKIKNARYVSRNIEISQEFSFAAEETKLKVNDVYNTSWYGSVLWDLFSPAAVRLESSWNRSMKVMLDLPLATHRNLIEPLSGRSHIRRVFILRFLNMISSIRESKKPLLRTLLTVTQYRTTSTTGRNLRHIMLLQGENRIEDIKAEASLCPYFPLPDEEAWRVEQLQGMMEEKKVVELEKDKMDLFKFLCTK
jgi:hypothetical protein